MPRNDASASFTDLVQVHALGTDSGVADRFLLGGSAGLRPVLSSNSATRLTGSADLFSIEIEGRDLSREDLEIAIATVTSSHYLAGSIFTETLSAARLTRRIVEEIDPWLATVFGIDPDYFFGVVPLEVPGHRRIESFVLGLKPARTPKAKLSLLIKRLLILSGFSAPLYERFATVLETTKCS